MEKLASSLELFTICVLYLLLPFSPLGCAFLSCNGRYLRDYVGTVQRCAVMLAAMRKTGVLRRNLLRVIRRRTVKYRPTELIRGDCTHCGRCCIDGACVFVEFVSSARSKCSIYGNWFWRRTNCGQYPMTSADIAVYKCPSFEVIPIKIVLSLR